MNTPIPAPQPVQQLNPIQASAPTLGAIIGSVLGGLAAAKSGITDPLSAQAIQVSVTAIVTGLFHWVGQKLGVAFG